VYLDFKYLMSSVTPIFSGIFITKMNIYTTQYYSGWIALCIYLFIDLFISLRLRSFCYHEQHDYINKNIMMHDKNGNNYYDNSYYQYIIY